MLRIRRIYDNVLPVNKSTLSQVQEILRSRFSAVDPKEIDHIAEKLRNPFKQRFRTILFVAESIKAKVKGFAMLLHEPELHFAYLDWIATASGRAGAGIGGALYDRIRREATALKAGGLFYECLPDDAKDCPDPGELKQNRARLRFYERYGARPIVNTEYESPVKPEDTCTPHLVYDDLGTGRPLKKAFARQVVRAILERKYADYCPADYVDRVVESFKDDPVGLREFRYVKPEAVVAVVESRSADQIALVVNDRHDIHHVNERGVRGVAGAGEKHFKRHRAQRPVRRYQAPALSGQAPSRGPRCGFRGLSQTGLRRGAPRQISVSLYLPYSQQNTAPEGAVGAVRILLHRHLHPHQRQRLSGGPPQRGLRPDRCP